MLIEASVLARLLGMKLLTLEGTIVLSSAEVETFDSISAASSESNDLLLARSLTVGPALAEAGRLIAASAAELESSRAPSTDRR